MSKGKKQPFAWNGTEYPSQFAAARALGWPVSQVQYCAKRGYTCDEDYAHGAPEPIAWNGNTYEGGVTEAAAKLGLAESTLRNRLWQGFTCDEDMPRGYREREIIWNDQTYPSLQALASEKGVSRQRVFQWLEKGYSRDSDIQERAVMTEFKIRTGVEPPGGAERSVYDEIYQALEDLADNEWMAIDDLAFDVSARIKSSIYIHFKKAAFKIQTRTQKSDMTCTLFVKKYYPPESQKSRIRPFEQKVRANGTQE